MRRRLGLAALASPVLAVLLTAAPVTLAAEEHHTVRAYAGYFTTTGDETLNLGDIEYDNTAGYGVGYEYRGRWVGLALDYGRFGSDVHVENVGNSSADFDPATAGVMFHLLPGRPLDLYLGPEAAYIKYGSSNFSVPGVGRVRVDADNETTWGAKAGIDFKLFTPVRIGVSVEYLDASADFKIKDAASGSGSLDPKPVIAKVGVVFRF